MKTTPAVSAAAQQFKQVTPTPLPTPLPTRPSTCFEENCDWPSRQEAFRRGSRDAAHLFAAAAKARAVVTQPTRVSVNEARSLLGSALAELVVAFDESGNDDAELAFYIDGILENLHASIEGWSK
jgi:hypothetical protein